MRLRVPARPRTALALGLGLLAAACDARDPEPRPAALDSLAVEDDSVPASDSVDAGAGRAVPLRTHRLLIVNRTATHLQTFASAGAGRVALDDVPAGDSARVNILIGADLVRLEATDSLGQPIDSVELHLRADSLARWEVDSLPSVPLPG